MKTLERTPRPFDVGDRVEVTEENIRPWAATISTVKWSPRSGWWVEARRDDDGLTYTVAAARVAKLEEEGG